MMEKLKIYSYSKPIRIIAITGWFVVLISIIIGGGPVVLGLGIPFLWLSMFTIWVLIDKVVIRSDGTFLYLTEYKRTFSDTSKVRLENILKIKLMKLILAMILRKPTLRSLKLLI